MVVGMSLPVLVLTGWVGAAALLTALATAVGAAEHRRHLGSLSPAARDVLRERPRHASAENGLAAMQLERAESAEQLVNGPVGVRRARS
jgi:hypothetical protein